MIGLKGEVKLAFKLMMNSFNDSGFKVGEGAPKCFDEDDHMEFRGVTFDARSEVGFLEITAEKVKELLIGLNYCLEKRRVRLDAVQRLGGLAAQACEIKLHGKMFLRDIHSITLGLDQPNQHCSTDGEAAQPFRAACRWFIDQLEKSPRLEVVPRTPRGIIPATHCQTDAAGDSTIGGLFFNGECWFVPLELEYIGFMELRMLLKLLEIKSEALRNMHLQWATDNIGARDWVNSGRSKDRPKVALKLIQKIFQLAEELNLTIEAVRIPTHWNILADMLSRWNCSDLKLRRKTREELAEKLQEWQLEFPILKW